MYCRNTKTDKSVVYINILGSPEKKSNPLSNKFTKIR